MTDSSRTDAPGLARMLHSVDGKPYGAYKRLTGSAHDLGVFRVVFDHVQVDPYAPPSLLRISVGRTDADLPTDLIDDVAGRVATADFLQRAFAREAGRLVPEPSRSGGSGTVSIGVPGQEILERTGVVITEDAVEARISVGLPASGRRIRGRAAASLLTEVLPEMAEGSLLHAHLDADAVREHVRLYRDQLHLRSRLAARGLVAFVGNGAILPRRSGDSDLPLEHDAVPFASPASMRTVFELPSGRRIDGMGVAEGVSVIVGGGYHGKSTLLRAIERGIHPHIGGDGREWVLTRPDAVSIRAEDGRAVTDVDISPFIGDLPSGTDTRRFTTTNASGSTSQAANLVEAVDTGASTLLIDEDTSATNFMIRDERMRRLIPAHKEPITPFVDRIRPLREERGVSTVLVAGGSSAFFGVADQVIALDSYVPTDVTQQAHALVPFGDGSASVESFPVAAPRVPRAAALRPGGKRKPARSRGREVIQFGTEHIDLAAVGQLVDPAQTAAIAHALDRLAELCDGERTLVEAVDELYRRMDADGLDVLSPHRGHPGALARPRAQEVHAAVNRYRGLQMQS